MIWPGSFSQVELLGRYSNRTDWANGIERLSEMTSRDNAIMPLKPYAPVRKLRAEQVRDLVEAYEAGGTMRQLAARFKIHRLTVSEHLHRQGVNMRRQSLKAQQVAEASRLYELGWSVARIGEHFGVDGTTIWRALRGLGVRLRTAQGRER